MCHCREMLITFPQKKKQHRLSSQTPEGFLEQLYCRCDYLLRELPTQYGKTLIQRWWRKGWIFHAVGFWHPLHNLWSAVPETGQPWTCWGTNRAAASNAETRTGELCEDGETGWSTQRRSLTCSLILRQKQHVSRVNIGKELLKHVR